TNAQIVEALATLTNIVARDNQPGREGEMRLERFMKHIPPTFTGGYNPDGAYKWLEELEIIFEAMECSEEGKTTLGTYV
ncbi:cellular nucleic acid-binding protein, partial [Trifolium medium]|nr:cellular nucleic acid-binding protein [Trifolium medium]